MAGDEWPWVQQHRCCDSRLQRQHQVSTHHLLQLPRAAVEPLSLEVSRAVGMWGQGSVVASAVLGEWLDSILEPLRLGKPSVILLLLQVGFSL